MKKLLSILLIFVLIFSFCSCSSFSSDNSDTKSLVGSWEYNPDLTGEVLSTLVFQDDGNASFEIFGLDSTFDKYYCEENVLYLESSELSTSVKMAYRFSDDKDTLYLSEIDGSDEMIYHRAGSISGDLSKKDNNTSDNNSTTNTGNDSANDEEALIGVWECESNSEENPYYSACFNDDKTGTIFLDYDYVLTYYYCLDGNIKADLDDGTSVTVPYRFSKDRTALYLTASDGDELKFEKIELGIG